MTTTDYINFNATEVFNDIWSASQSGKYKLIVEEGSSRSSKTWSNFQVLFLDLFQNPFTICTILRDTQKSCRDIVETDWIKWLSDPMGRKKQLEDKEINIHEFDDYIRKESFLRYFIRNRTNHTWTFKHNNSFIRFTGLDDEDDAMGMTQDICWINEPYSFSHEVFKQLSQRTSKYILFDWNPKQEHWIRNEKLKDNTIVLYSTFENNPFCPLESKIQIQSYQPLNQFSCVLNKQIKEIECYNYDLESNSLNFTKKQLNELKRCLYNEKVKSASLYHWLVYGKGLKAEKPNRIYNGFKKISPEEFASLPYPSYYGLDFGSTNPSALCEVKTDGENSFFIKQLLYQPISEMKGTLSENINPLIKNKTIPIVCDYADPVRISELRLAGLNAIPCTPKAVNARIDYINSKKIYFTEDSSDFENEYENYEWEIHQGINLERPIKKDDHLMDSFAYCIMFLQFYLNIK